MRTHSIVWCCSLWLGLSYVIDAAKPMRMIERNARRTTIPRHPLLHDTTEIHDLTTDGLTHLYPAHTISTPIDHFHNTTLYEPHTNDTFPLRYYFDASYYKPGGPVIVLQGGETSATGRLPFLQKGILHDLIVATHGIGVVFEHRYYGKSIPTPDLSTKNLRFLTTEQALADQAYFAQNIVFPGLEHLNLTSAKVPYLTYGGSYAGGFSAFLRKLYPDVYWGAIASSGVTQAIYEYWQYFEPIRVYAPAKCVEHTQKITHAFDNILDKKNASLTAELKAAWNLANLSYEDDFAGILAIGIETWQSRNWDPAVGSPLFDQYCEYLTSSKIKNEKESGKLDIIKYLLSQGGYAKEVFQLAVPMLNWISWTRQVFIDHCTEDQDTCFGTRDAEFHAADNISQTWRSWPYQYCTQWGYLQYSRTPSPSILPIISKRLTLERDTRICKEAFNITTPSNVTAINQWGGFNISYPRLAFIDGEQDPWRGATPHAGPFAYDGPVKERENSVSEPWYLMDGAVHHWDENGLSRDERKAGKKIPEPVESVQKEEVRFVLEWMKEWRESKGMAEKVEL